MRFRWSALVLLCLLLAAAATAQARIFTSLGAGNGLDARTVTTVMIDSQGYLWVGSGEGLYRYDGYQAQAFLPDPENPDAISDIDIRFVYEDRDGIIWVATNSNGLDRFDPLTGVFRHFRHDPAAPASVGDDQVYGIAEGPLGALWVAGESGLSRLDRESMSFEHFRHDPADPQSLSDNRAFSLHLAESGNLWVSTLGGGVNLWNPQKRMFLRYNLAALTGGPAERNAVLAVHEDNNILWAGTREGLVRLDIETGQAELVDLGRQDGNLPVITAMDTDDSNRLWLSTMDRGLLIVDQESREWNAASQNPLGGAGNLTTDALMSVAIGSDLVFAGTRGSGVFRAPVRETGFRLLSMQNTERLGNNVISTVMATEEDGMPWVGTFGGGPRHVDVVQRLVRSMPLKRHGMRTSGVMSLAGPIDGRLYAATTHGLYEFSVDSAQVALFEYDPGNPDGIGKGDVIALLPAEGNRLWLGLGGGGLQLFDTRTQRFQSYRHQPDEPGSLSGDFVTALLDESGEHIWVGTRSAGLNLCRTQDQSCQRIAGHNCHVTALYRDRRGRIWVGTDGGGLHLVQRGDNGDPTGFEQWGREDGLLNNRIMAIQEDLDESLWLTTRQGISRFNPATGDVYNYVAASGLPTTHFNNNASAADGRFIYFGSTNGLLSIQKGSLLAKRGAAEVRIASVEHGKSGNRERVTARRDDTLSLPYQEELSIELAVLDFAESNYEYAYRLRPSDPWLEVGQKRQIVFNSLSPGQYEIQARGRNAYGVWGESIPLKLNVIPPFWMATWFRALVVLLFAALLWTLHLARQAVLRRRANEMLRLGETRERALEEQLGTAAELAVLTPRQKEILQLIAEGKSTREIAELLGVSIKTVEAHRANLMERLDIYDVPGLVRLAVRSHLVPLQS